MVDQTHCNSVLLWSLVLSPFIRCEGESLDEASDWRLRPESFPDHYLFIISGDQKGFRVFVDVTRIIF